MNSKIGSNLDLIFNRRGAQKSSALNRILFALIFFSIASALLIPSVYAAFGVIVTINLPASDTNFTASNGTMTVNATTGTANTNCTLAVYNSTGTQMDYSQMPSNLSTGHESTTVSVNLPDGVYTLNVTCYNSTNASDNNTASRTFTVDSTSLTVNSVAVTPDIFVCARFANNSDLNRNVTLNVSATDALSGVAWIRANISQINSTAPLVALSYSSGFWQATFPVNNTTTQNFASTNITLTAADYSGNSYVGQTYTSVVLYNMTIADTGNACIQFGSSTTNFCDITDFARANYVEEVKLNGSAGCFASFDLPWGNTFQKVMLINFSSVDLSSPSIGSKIGAIGSAIMPSITLPPSFGNSYLTVDSSAFNELNNTNTTITMFGLPFGSMPVIQGPGIPFSVSWAQDTPYNYSGFLIPKGNLTFTVSHFSQYNMTDNVNPIVNITAPANLSSIGGGTVLINVTVNGTGTELSNITATLDSTTLFSYNNTQIQSACHNLTTGWDKVYCEYSATGVTAGTKTLTVIAYDYGGNSPGNHGSNTTTFTVDTTAPGISGISASGITNTSAIINATTSEAATCILNYGTTSSYGTNSTATASGTSHTNTTRSLTAGTTYYYRWNCTDAYGNSALSTGYNFTTAIYNTTWINTTTTADMVFNFTSYGSADLNLSLNQTVNATVTVTPSGNSSNLFSISGYSGLGTYYSITSGQVNSSNLGWVIIKLYYNESDISSSVDESALRLYWYNTTSAAWEEIPGGVDTTNNYVWGNSTHFSEYTIVGQNTVTTTPVTERTSSSPGGAPAGRFYKLNLDTTPSFTQANLSTGDQVEITVNNEKHILTVSAMSADSVVADISSVTSRYTLNLNAPKAIDLNKDGTTEFEITMTRIASGKADLAFTKTSVPAPSATEEITEPAATQQAEQTASAAAVATTVSKVTGNYGVYVLAAIALAGIGALVYFVLLKKKK